MSGPIDRREFLERSILAGGLAATLPAASWARMSRRGDAVNLAVIGCGPAGQAIMSDVLARRESERVNISRVCDLYQPRLAAAAERAGLDQDHASMEYRDVLDDPEIHGVVVATPDHWHAKLAVEALGAGKAVLVESPLSHTIPQALEVRDAVARTSGVLCVVARQCSDDRYWRLREAISQDRMGKISWSQGSFCLNSRIPLFNRPHDGVITDDHAQKGFVWWDRWLGHEWGLAPRVPFDPDRFFRYQKYYDYGTGMAGELLFGVLAPLLLAVSGPRGEYPARVTSGGGRYAFFDQRETPDQLMSIIDYPREHTIVLAACATNDTNLERTIRGRHATATLVQDGVRVQEQAGYYPEFRGSNKDLVDAGMSRDAKGRWIPDPPKGEVGFTLSSGERRDYLGNFLAALRGEDRPACGAELACASMVAVRMISDAFRTGRVVRWDADAGRVVED